MRIALALLSAVLPLCFAAQPRVGDGWGVSANFTKGSPSAAEWTMLAAAFKTVRWDVAWGRVETRCRVYYDWAAPDALVQAAAVAGVRPYLALSGISSCYAPGCDDPTCLSGFANYTRLLRLRYKGRAMFQCLSEPELALPAIAPPSYGAMCVAAGATFNISRDVFYAGSVALPAAAQLASAAGLAYLNQTLRLKLVERAPLSGVAVHLSRACAAPPESVFEQLASVREMMVASAVDRGEAMSMPIVSSSWGYAASSVQVAAASGGADCDTVTQGKYLARSWLVGLLAGVRVNLWSGWRDEVGSLVGDGVVVKSANASTLPAPKPAYLAALAAQSTVGNARAFVARLDAAWGTAPAPAGSLGAADVFSLQFSTSDGPSFAVWSNSSDTCDAAGAAPAACVLSTPGNVTFGACLAAGCCFDDRRGASGTAGAACFIGRPPRVVSFLTGPLPPTATPEDFCWQQTDTFGFSRGAVCASAGGFLSVNVTDGPSYLTPIPVPVLDTATAAVLPGQAVMVTGAALAASSLVLCPHGTAGRCTVPLPAEFVPQEDSSSAPTAPLSWPIGRLEGCLPLPTLQRSASSIKAAVPANATADAWWAVAVQDNGSGTSNCLSINMPRVKWISVGRSAPAGDAYPGAAFSMFGEALRFADSGTEQGFDCAPLFPLEGAGAPNFTAAGRAAQTELRARGFAVPTIALRSDPSPGGLAQLIPCPVALASCFRVDATIPAAVPPGNYSIVVRDNGLPATALFPEGTVVARLRIAAPPPAWNTGASLTVGFDCANISACLRAAPARFGASGGTVWVPAGRYLMGRNEVVNISAGVQLVGAPAASGEGDAASVVLQWDSNPLIVTIFPDFRPSAAVPIALVTGEPRARWAIRNLTLLVTSPQQFTVALLDSIGAQVTGVIINTTIAESVQAGPFSPLYVLRSRHWEVSNCTIIHHVACAARFPYTYYGVFELSADGAVRNNYVNHWCAGYDISNSQRVVFDQNTLLSLGTTKTEGNTLCTLSAGVDPLEHIYVGRNYFRANNAATNCEAGVCRFESMTTDGPGGAFYGYLAGIGMDSVTGRQVLLVPILDMLRQTALVPRLIVLVISGPAAGQWRRIVSVVSNRAPVTVAGILYPAGGIRYAALDSPFGQPFDIGSSAVTIGIMKGRFILEGNRFINGTQVQTYGLAVNPVFVGNSMENLTQPYPGHPLGALNLYGGMYKYPYNHQPNLHAVLEQNTLWCSENMSVHAVSPLQPNWWFHYGHTVRRNRMLGRSGASIAGATADMLYEDNTFSPALCPINYNYTDMATLVSAWEVREGSLVIRDPIALPAQGVLVRPKSERVYTAVPLPTPSSTATATSSSTPAATVTPSTTGAATAAPTARAQTGSANESNPSSGGAAGLDGSGQQAATAGGASGGLAAAGSAAGSTKGDALAGSAPAVSVLVGIAVFVVVLAAALLLWRARRSRRTGWVRAGPLSAGPADLNGLSVASGDRFRGGRGVQIATTNPLRAGGSSGADGAEAGKQVM